MAKKYQAIQTKVHWLTWTIIGVVVVSLIGLVIALQPSAKDNFYDNYLVRAQDATFQQKLPKDNKYQLVDSLENKWYDLFDKGVYELAERDNHLTIVFFGDYNNLPSVVAVANVYARLYGSNETNPAIQPSALHTSLGDAKLSLYHYSVKEAAFLGLVDKLNEKYDDTIEAVAMPMVVAFLDGQVIAQVKLEATSQASQLFNFYNEILEKDVVQDLLK